MPDCIARRFEFQGPGRRQIVADFSGGQITSDGGVMLVGEVDRRRRVAERLAACFEDFRDPDRVEHSVAQMLRQRLYALALGYEDVNDHEELRADPLLAAVVGKTDPTGTERARQRDQGKALAGKSTLNRLELTPPEADAASRYKKIVACPEAMDALLVDLFLEAHDTAPHEIILDVDATDDPLHGHQEGRFFHGYYRGYCYLPLYIFCGEHLLCARLRQADQDGAVGTQEELERIIGRIRRQWPQTRMIVRGDSGFCRDDLMSWCEAHDVAYVLGLAKNSRLKTAIAAEMAEAKAHQATTYQAARVVRDFPVSHPHALVL